MQNIINVLSPTNQSGMKNKMKSCRENFAPLLMQWDKGNRRAMPWKGEKDPYKIWLSEIILQQTRVEQGKPYYERFIAAYPTVADLANADEKAAFRLWQGLGYYNRCKNMLSAARRIMTDHEGIFPSSYGDILQLPGVGEYTAAAIASFAFHLPYAVVDGNVQRVLARYFGIYETANTTAGKRYFTQLAQQLLAQNNPAVFNQAIMDFGATVCTPKQPACAICPLNTFCYAYRHHQINALPVKLAGTPSKKRYFYYLVFSYKNTYYIRRRDETDIWKNLYEFLLFEKDKPGEKHLLQTLPVQALLKGYAARSIAKPATYRQQLTHQLIEATFIHISLEKPLKPVANLLAVNKSAFNEYPFPKVIVRYLQDEKLIGS